VDNGTILFSGPRIKGYMIKQGREIKGSETCDECKWELVGSFQGNMGRRMSKRGPRGETYLLQRKSGSPLSRPRDR
jgi:hypothetical protein